MREEKYMDYDIEMNKKDYQREKEARAKRLEAYAEAIQTITLQKSSKVIEELIEERRRQEFLHRIWRGWRAEKGFQHWSCCKNTLRR